MDLTRSSLEFNGGLSADLFLSPIRLHLEPWLKADCQTVRNSSRRSRRFLGPSGGQVFRFDYDVNLQNCRGTMARPLRIEYDGAFYPEAIFGVFTFDIQDEPLILHD